MVFRINKRVLITSGSALVIIVGTILAVQFAQGGRPNSDGTLRETGLLVANSFPTASQVLIDGKLTTATDDSLNLDPGTYEIEIRQDGYTAWKKNLLVEKELVVQTNALLFPTAPSFSPVTFTGAQNINPAPDGQKLIYYTASASAEAKNGLYLADLTDSPLSLQRGPRQISTDSQKVDLSSAKFIWSPDSLQVLVTDGNHHYLLGLTTVNNIDTMQDVTLTVNQTLSEWEQEMALREQQILSKFPESIIQVATSSAVNVYFAPDQTKLLYTATRTVQLPDSLFAAPRARSTQPQERRLEPGMTYVYDLKEDTNFLVGRKVVPLPTGTVTPTPAVLTKRLLSRPLPVEETLETFDQLQASSSAETADNFLAYHSGLFSGELQWYPDSKHLIRTQSDRITILEYDGTNEVTVYTGPFDSKFVYPWSNGDRLLILTSFNQPSITIRNLYAIELK